LESVWAAARLPPDWGKGVNARAVPCSTGTARNWEELTSPCSSALDKDVTAGETLARDEGFEVLRFRVSTASPALTLDPNTESPGLAAALERGGTASPEGAFIDL
jgi:hypothetical protein